MTLSMVHSSVAMISGRVANMAFGLGFWVLASRSFPTHSVGLTAGVVAALLVCVQLSLVGLDSSFISHFPRHRLQLDALLDTSISMVLGASVLVAGGFLMLTTGVFDELRVVSDDPWYGAMFVVTAAAATVGYFFDQVSMAQGRGDHVFVRSGVNGLLKVGPLVVLAALGLASSSQALFSLWLVGAVAAAATGLWQFWHTANGYWFRPRIHRHLARGLIGAGVPHHALTLADRLPGLLLPILVLELLSPTQNAYWYGSWMAALVVYFIPMSIGIGLFAEITNRPEEARAQIGRAMKAALGLGAPVAVLVAITAPVLLRVLGPEYAGAGSAPLRLLMLAVVPMTFVHVYYAVCRATGRLREAVALSGSAGLLMLAATVVVAPAGGLAAIATAWIVIQTGAAAFAARRLKELMRASAVPAEAFA